MWKFKFDAPKGHREYHKGFFGVCCHPKDQNKANLCWDHDFKRWVCSRNQEWSSTHTDEKVRNFRQFKKHLRKHPELRVEGVEVVLANRYYVVDEEGKFLHDLSIRAYWQPL